MLPARILASTSRAICGSQRRRILSAAFSLEKEWSARHAELNKLGLGGDYEWISAVQKKFIGGIGSAIDVDAAVCIAEQKDQVDDVIDLIYKLRHCENAADLPESAEYALIRLLLKHEPEIIFKLAQDPINYGIFLNEHSACLAIDHFIKVNNIQGAARLAAWVMQQEMTSSELLNLLVLYSCAKWSELPTDQQTMPKEEVVEEEVSDDDLRTFKFPFLKNPHFDGHFDLDEPAHLCGKTLLWIARDSQLLDTELRDSLRLLGAILLNRLDIAETLASSKIHGFVAEFVAEKFTPKEEGSEMEPQQKKIVDALAGCQKAEKSLSDSVLEILTKVQSEEENKLAERQKNEFIHWNNYREELVKSQAERVLLKIRLDEIAKELADIEHKNEMFFFFENRLKWEKKANENNEISEESAAQAASS